MTTMRHFSFVGGESGSWRVRGMAAVAGESLPFVKFIHVREGVHGTDGKWHLRGVRSNERYTTRAEHDQLAAVQEGLGRAEATWAALIPIRKTAAWWALSQDERRAIFEEQSHHTAVGLRVLPAVARRLYHCRDLPTAEGFDFLTWFEFAPEAEPDFDHLLVAMRSSQEWSYVDREVDIRLVRNDA